MKLVKNPVYNKSLHTQGWIQGGGGVDWVANHPLWSSKKKMNIIKQSISRLIIRLFTVLQSCLKTREMPFQRPEISKFPGGACPRTPLGARAYGARRLAPSALDHTRHQPPPLQKSWIRPWNYVRGGLYTGGTIYGRDYLREELSLERLSTGGTIYLGRTL